MDQRVYIASVVTYKLWGLARVGVPAESVSLLARRRYGGGAWLQLGCWVD